MNSKEKFHVIFWGWAMGLGTKRDQRRFPGTNSTSVRDKERSHQEQMPLIFSSSW